MSIVPKVKEEKKRMTKAVNPKKAGEKKHKQLWVIPEEMADVNPDHETESNGLKPAEKTQSLTKSLKKITRLF